MLAAAPGVAVTETLRVAGFKQEEAVAGTNFCLYDRVDGHRQRRLGGHFAAATGAPQAFLQWSF